jgi:hypothetical protein
MPLQPLKSSTLPTIIEDFLARGNVPLPLYERRSIGGFHTLSSIVRGNIMIALFALSLLPKISSFTSPTYSSSFPFSYVFHLPSSTHKLCPCNLLNLIVRGNIMIALFALSLLPKISLSIFFHFLLTSSIRMETTNTSSFTSPTYSSSFPFSYVFHLPSSTHKLVI